MTRQFCREKLVKNDNIYGKILHCAQFSCFRCDFFYFSNSICQCNGVSYLFSFLITISHFLLYVPTMLVIGLHGWFLHPIAILLCDMVVYSEFLIHPILLLSTSTKLRQEIKQTLQRLCQDTISFANGGQTDFCIKVPRLSWNFALLTN